MTRRKRISYPTGVRSITHAAFILNSARYVVEIGGHTIFSYSIGTTTRKHGKSKSNRIVTGNELEAGIVREGGHGELDIWAISGRCRYEELDGRDGTILFRKSLSLLFENVVRDRKRKGSG